MLKTSSRSSSLSLIVPLFVACLAVFISSPCLLGQDGSIQAQFDEANKFYEQGLHSEAVAAYQALRTSDYSSAALFFNLGNAHFHEGNRGLAIANFLRAEKLSPRDPDVQKSLNYARLAVTGIKAPDRAIGAMGWIKLISLNEWSIVSAAFLWIGVLALTANQLISTLAPKIKLITATAWFGFFISTTVLVVGAKASLGTHPAVVIDSEAVIRYGPLEESRSYFQLPVGSEVTVHDTKDGWLKVKDRGQRLGWLKELSVEQID
jgi:tetratricopeptide (TPR) repeat protein